MVDRDTLVSLCKRQGFVHQPGEIYGGISYSWDYGPLGAELQRRGVPWPASRSTG